MPSAVISSLDCIDKNKNFLLDIVLLPSPVKYLYSVQIHLAPTRENDYGIFHIIFHLVSNRMLLHRNARMFSPFPSNIFAGQN